MAHYLAEAASSPPKVLPDSVIELNSIISNLERLAPPSECTGIEVEFFRRPSAASISPSKEDDLISLMKDELEVEANSDPLENFERRLQSLKSFKLVNESGSTIETEFDEMKNVPNGVDLNEFKIGKKSGSDSDEITDSDEDSTVDGKSSDSD